MDENLVATNYSCDSLSSIKNECPSTAEMPEIKVQRNRQLSAKAADTKQKKPSLQAKPMSGKSKSRIRKIIDACIGFNASEEKQIPTKFVQKEINDEKRSRKNRKLSAKKFSNSSVVPAAAAYNQAKPSKPKSRKWFLKEISDCTGNDDILIEEVMQDEEVVDNNSGDYEVSFDSTENEGPVQSWSSIDPIVTKEVMQDEEVMDNNSGDYEVSFDSTENEGPVQSWSRAITVTDLRKPSIGPAVTKTSKSEFARIVFDATDVDKGVKTLRLKAATPMREIKMLFPKHLGLAEDDFMLCFNNDEVMSETLLELFGENLEGEHNVIHIVRSIKISLGGVLTKKYYYQTPSTPFSVIRESVADFLKEPETLIGLVYNGQEVLYDQTPELLNMKHGELLEVIKKDSNYDPDYDTGNVNYHELLDKSAMCEAPEKRCSCPPWKSGPPLEFRESPELRNIPLREIMFLDLEAPPSISDLEKENLVAILNSDTGPPPGSRPNNLPFVWKTPPAIKNAKTEVVSIQKEGDIDEVLANNRQLEVRKDKKKVKPKCALSSCENQGKHRCSRCKAIFYCHNDCLSKDWSHHKKYCDYVYKLNKVPDVFVKDAEEIEISGTKEDAKDPEEIENRCTKEDVD